MSSMGLLWRSFLSPGHPQRDIKFHPWSTFIFYVWLRGTILKIDAVSWSVSVLLLHSKFDILSEDMVKFSKQRRYNYTIADNVYITFLKCMLGVWTIFRVEHLNEYLREYSNKTMLKFWINIRVNFLHSNSQSDPLCIWERDWFCLLVKRENNFIFWSSTSYLSRTYELLYSPRQRTRLVHSDCALN